MAKYECLKCGNKYKSISGWTHHLTQEENDDLKKRVDDLKKYISRLQKDYAILQTEYYDISDTLQTVFTKAKEIKRQRDVFAASLEIQRRRGIYIDDDFIYDEKKGPFIYKIPRTGAEYFIFSRQSFARLAIRSTKDKTKLIEGVRDKLNTKEKELKKLQRATSGKNDNLEKLKKLYSTALATIKSNQATIADLTAKTQAEAQKKAQKRAERADDDDTSTANTENNSGGPAVSTENNSGGPAAVSTENNSGGSAVSTENNSGGSAVSTENNSGGPVADTKTTKGRPNADDEKQKILYDFEILNKFAKSLIYERTGRKPLYISVYYLTTIRGLDCYFNENFNISLDQFIEIFNKLKALRLNIAHPPIKKLDYHIIANVINRYQHII